MKRRKMSGRSSKKVFRKNLGSRKRNTAKPPMRGGIRL